MTDNTTASLRYLAAGNIHFSGPCAVLRLQGVSEFAQPHHSFETVWIKAMEHLQEYLGTSRTLNFPEDHAPSTLLGQAACLAVAVQYATGLAVPIDFKWREFPEDKSCAAFSCADRATGHAAAALALSFLTGEHNLEKTKKITKKLIDSVTPWTQPLAKAAMSRGIPVIIAAAAERPFLALGQGNKRRLFWKQFTPHTSHVATALSTRKDLTTMLLREAGFPAPRNVVVRDAKHAVRAAQQIGYPVVIKPVAADYGRGVSTGNHDAHQVRHAFIRAAEWGTVLVEEQITGDQHRLLVMHGRCVAVSRRLPARVVGNGVSTISQLVEVVNQTRSEKLSSAGVKIKLDEVALELLKQQNMTPFSVPEAGHVVVLRGNANQSSGGTVEMMTDVAHPTVLRMAVKVAALLGIDVAGIDYLTTDITQSPDHTQGAICEVNVTPGFVNQGDEDELLGKYLAPIFPKGVDGRILTVCVVGVLDGQWRWSNALASLIDTTIAKTSDVRFWKERDAAALPRRTAAVLADPLTSAALITCMPDEIKTTGLGLERCTLAVLESGVDQDVAVAMLRTTTHAVLPASIIASLVKDPLLVELLQGTWGVGEYAEADAQQCAGWVHRINMERIEICPRSGASWTVSSASFAQDAEVLVAIGAALTLSQSHIVSTLRLHAVVDGASIYQV